MPDIVQEEALLSVELEQGHASKHHSTREPLKLSYASKRRMRDAMARQTLRAERRMARTARQGLSHVS